MNGQHEKDENMLLISVIPTPQNGA